MSPLLFHRLEPKPRAGLPHGRVNSPADWPPRAHPTACAVASRPPPLPVCPHQPQGCLPKQERDKTVTNKIVKFSKTLFIIYFSGKCLSLWMKLIIYSHIGERFIRYTNRPFSNLAYSVCEGKGFEHVYRSDFKAWEKKLLPVKAFYSFKMQCLLYTVLFMQFT